MTLHLSDDGLKLTGIELESYHRNQLKAWDFVSITRDEMRYGGDVNIADMALKICRFFDRNGIIYSVTEEVKNILETLEQARLAFENNKLIGRNIKDGRTSPKTFHDFTRRISECTKRSLKDHQLKSAFHLYQIRNGANFSVPGSGKTSVVLAVYELLKLENEVNALFVVGPPACFDPWQHEFKETLGRSPRTSILAGGDKQLRKNEYYANSSRTSELYLTTFQTLINDQDEVKDFFSQQGIDIYMVVDEAHYIKQINGNWANAILNIANTAKFKCILTGTPIPKNYSDVFNLFDFLWPDQEVIDSENRLRLKSLENASSFDEAKEILDDKIGPLFYRVRKKDLNLMPAKFHDPVRIEMGSQEKEIYEAISQNIRNYSIERYLKNIDFINSLKRGRIIRLRQACSNPTLLSTAIEGYDEDLLKDHEDLRSIILGYSNLELPAKLQYLTLELERFRKEKKKAVIWSTFVGTIEMIERHLTDLGIYCRCIYGKTPIEKSENPREYSRGEVRDEFVDPNSGLDVLIANPAACAESISLHKTCFHAFYYDLSYNCAQYLQSLDRIHRVGGSETQEANYYFLQYRNTIDQDIFDNLNLKAARMYKIIDNEYRIYSLDMLESYEGDEIEAYDRIFNEK